MESEVLIVQKIPLSPAVVITMIVSLSGEIDPLWVTELITHKIEVSLSTERLCDQSDHLMKCQTSAHPQRWCTILVHASIDFLIEEPH